MIPHYIPLFLDWETPSGKNLYVHFLTNLIKFSGFDFLINRQLLLMVEQQLQTANRTEDKLIH